MRSPEETDVVTERSSKTSEPPARDSERPRSSAPPPDFDDDPVHSITRQTPQSELARWRRMAARGKDRSLGPEGETELTKRTGGGTASEVTRAVPNPLGTFDDVTPRPLPTPADSYDSQNNTVEVPLDSGVIALSRRDPSGPMSLAPRQPSGPMSLAPRPPSGPMSLPPRAAPRPALRPDAGSLPPDAVPRMPTPAIGVSLSPLGLAPAGTPSRAAPRARSSPWIAALVIVLALIGAAIVLWAPRRFGSGARSTAAPPPAGTEAPVAPSRAPGGSIGAAIGGAVMEPAAEASGATAIEAAPVEVAPVELAPVEAPAIEAPARVVEAATIGAPSAPAAATELETPAALVAEGDRLSEAGRLEEALATYQRALALDSHHPYAFAGAARACLEFGRADDAVRYAERAVANRQRRAVFRVLLGDALRAAGREDRARSEWERALEIDPDDAAARERLGR